jgi:arginyl-tRNA synthetase
MRPQAAKPAPVLDLRDPLWHPAWDETGFDQMNLFADIRALVVAELTAMKAEGALPQGLNFAHVAVEPPRDSAHGDMATNAAMVLAKPAGLAPRAIADALAARLA